MGYDSGEGFFAHIVNMRASVQELITMTGTTVAAVDDLNEIANKSKQLWTGEARNTFDTESVTWNDACSDMVSKLNISAAALDEMADNYHIADQKGVDNFNGAGKP